MAMAPREIDELLVNELTPYPLSYLPDNYEASLQTASNPQAAIIAVENGSVEAARRSLELQEIYTHIARLLTVYPTRRGSSAYSIVAQSLYDYSGGVIDNLYTDEASEAAEEMVRLVQLARSHEWFVEESKNVHDNKRRSPFLS